MAVIYQSFNVVWELLNLGAALDLKDLNGNSIFHCGAESTGPILAVGTGHNFLQGRNP